MQVKRLVLTDFRNIERAEITFSPEMNFLLGDNAQGKTNAMEAIYLFARGKSFRGASDRELVRFGARGYGAALTFDSADREETLFCGFSGKEKIRKRNGILLEKQAELLGHFRAVLFCPDHLQMIKGAPSERRRFLDVAISQCYPVYLSLYAHYAKYLEQRNALLKNMQKGFGLDRDLLSAFSEGLAEYASEIYLYRRSYVDALKEKAKEIMHALSGGKEQMDICYQADIKDHTLTKQEVFLAYKRLFSAHVDRECAVGSSLFGIHRDEMDISLNGISIRDFGSQGQQRSAVLALKMAEGALSRDITGDYPVYLFDDVLSELDEDRRAFLLSGMKECQFIVSGCEKSVLGHHTASVRFIPVQGGRFGE